MARCRILLLFFHYRSLGGILLYGSDAVFEGLFAGIHLAGADDLLVGSDEVEVGFAVLGDLAYEFGVVNRVFLYGFDACEAGSLDL